MGKFVDLTGQQFNQLTVLERDKTKSGVYWLCKCSCGKIISVKTDKLKAGQKSCGCHTRQVDITSHLNEVYGQLTVIKRDLSKPIGHGCESYWICQCTCGNEISVRFADLQSGHTQSCGCLRAKANQERCIKDLTNQKFGLLTAIENTHQLSPHGTYIWRCSCECGNNNYYCSVENLLSGKVNSCGCKHRTLGEIKIKQLLQENNIQFIEQYSFSDLQGKNNSLLKFDFAIFTNQSLSRLIEFDGEQHYNENSLFYSVEGIERDKIKNEYAISHNIPLVRIPYSYLNKLNIDSLLGKEFLINA